MYTEAQKIKTAERIKEEREKRGLSHVALAQELCKLTNDERFISSDTLKLYEVTDTFSSERFNRKQGMNIGFLNAFAEYFGVSTDYLLGRVDEKTPSTSVRAICKETRLSEDAVQALIECGKLFPAILNALLTQPAFKETLNKIRNYAVDLETLERMEQKRVETEPNPRITGSVSGLTVRQVAVPTAEVHELYATRAWEALLPEVVSEARGKIPMPDGFFEEREKYFTNVLLSTMPELQESAKPKAILVGLVAENTETTNNAERKGSNGKRKN